MVLRVLWRALLASACALVLAYICLVLWLWLPSGKTRILFVGDSTVAGYTDNPTWKIPFDYGFRARVVERLEAQGCEFAIVGSSPEPWNGKSGKPVLLAGARDLDADGLGGHRGYGGLTLRQILYRFPGWLAQDNPDIIVFQAGINSIPQGSMSISEDNLRTLSAIRWVSAAMVPDADFIAAQIGPYATKTPALDQYNAYIAGNFTSADVASVFGNSNPVDPLLFANGINHPTNEVYRRIGDVWADAVIKILKRRGACPAS